MLDSQLVQFSDAHSEVRYFYHHLLSIFARFFRFLITSPSYFCSRVQVIAVKDVAKVLRRQLLILQSAAVLSPKTKIS